MDQKCYYHHSGYIGGLKTVPIKDLMKKKPEDVVRFAVRGMLPKNRLGRKIFKKLKVYPGDTHPHDAQRQVLVFFEQADEGVAEAREHAPVDVADVVAGRVLAVVGELEPAADLLGLALGSLAPADQPTGDDLEQLELAEEFIVEQVVAIDLLGLGLLPPSAADAFADRHGLGEPPAGAEAEAEGE